MANGSYSPPKSRHCSLPDSYLRGQTRERLLVQADRHVDVQAYLRSWLARAPVAKAVRVSVDVDPVSFF